MATFIWHNARVFIDAYDFSAQFSLTRLDYVAEMRDATAMQVAAAPTRIHKAGLWQADITHRGFLDFAEDGIEDIISTALGVGGTHDITMIPFPQGAAGVIADADHAYFGQFVNGRLTWAGNVGDMAEFDWEAHGNEQLGKGRVSIDDVIAVTGVVNGTGYQLGDATAFPGIGGPIDVPSGDRVVAMVHVVADDFTDLDFVLESDDAAPFGTATVLASSLNHTGISSAFLQSDGSTPISDDFFRLRVSGFTGTSATVIGSVAVVRGR